MRGKASGLILEQSDGPICQGPTQCLCWPTLGTETAPNKILDIFRHGWGTASQCKQYWTRCTVGLTEGSFRSDGGESGTQVHKFLTLPYPPYTPWLQKASERHPRESPQGMGQLTLSYWAALLSTFSNSLEYHLLLLLEIQVFFFCVPEFPLVSYNPSTIIDLQGLWMDDLVLYMKHMIP